MTINELGGVLGLYANRARAQKQDEVSPTPTWYNINKLPKHNDLQNRSTILNIDVAYAIVKLIPPRIYIWSCLGYESRLTADKFQINLSV